VRIVGGCEDGGWDGGGIGKVEDAWREEVWGGEEGDMQAYVWDCGGRGDGGRKSEVGKLEGSGENDGVVGIEL